MRRKFRPMNSTLNSVAPAATAARYRGSSRWPTTAVSTSPSSGVLTEERIIGAAIRQRARSPYAVASGTLVGMPAQL
jgi:hypothetical protein